MHRRSTTLPATRTLNAAGFVLTASAVLFGVLYLQGTLYLEPCPLCIVNRMILIGMGTVFLLAALHNPRTTGQRIYASINLLLAAAGIATAVRHVWLQHLPADRAPECGASLSYMLENLPLYETFKRVLQGSGECAAVQWTFLGLSIAELTLLLLVALLVLPIIQLARK
jgi:protein dithiol:quinone oxidoreductase